MIGNPFRRRPAAGIEQDGLRHGPRDTVPVTLLPGFLGSGKTTLLNDMLSDPAMAGTAVIVNEFGTVGIDHDLVRRGSEAYLRTTTGCICCTAASDIRVSLYDLHDARSKGDIAPISRVIIETTGLADPAPMINSLIPGGAPAFGLRDHIVARNFRLAGVLTAFDALNGLQTLGAFLEGWKQVAFADHIILTKTDLAGADRNGRGQLAAINPAARLHDRHAAGFDLAGLMTAGSYSTSGKAEDVTGWLAMEQLSRPAGHAHDANRHGGDIEAISLVRDPPLERQAIETFLKVVTGNIGSGLLRLKGIFSTLDDPDRPLIAHAVQHTLHPLQRLDRWPDEDRRTRVVLIGQAMPAEPIRDLFDALRPRVRKTRGGGA